MSKQAVELKETSPEEKFAALQALTCRASAMTDTEIEEAKKKSGKAKGNQKRVNESAN